ncbi:MAG TPA: hypothetical protein VKU89_09300 [Solirubrobacteraceae bacterium]|nr:hypothetical protein [Solirubrobacteraceae bacterium]
MRKLLLLILAPLLIVAMLPASATARARRYARQRPFSGYDNAYLHLIHASGSKLIEEGDASGALPGRVHAVLFVGATFHGSFTIYTRNGEIFGHGSATPHRGAGEIESFAGKTFVTGGTGRFRGAHGTGGLYGTFNRRNYQVVLQTRGTLYT